MALVRPWSRIFLFQLVSKNSMKSGKPVDSRKEQFDRIRYVFLVWPIIRQKNLLVANPGFARRGAPTQRWGTKLLFWPFFTENCMKMKISKIGSRGSNASLYSPMITVTKTMHTDLGLTEENCFTSQWELLCRFVELTAAVPTTAPHVVSTKYYSMCTHP